MLTMLENWKGTININGVDYPNVKDAEIALNKPVEGNIHIVLKPVTINRENKAESTVYEHDNKPVEYRITVKQYMTKKSSPEFDFMAKWNNDNPMPLRTMTGSIVKETRGMVYMKLHGDIWQEKICTCMCCGRPLTNPVSQYFGIGPECGGHNYVNPFDNENELKSAVAAYKKQLQNTTWEGWVIKSAIQEQVEVE